MRASPTSRLLGAAAAAALLVAIPAGAGQSATRKARTIDVEPGKKALANALSKARDGDTIRLHAGTYKGAVEITKSVSIVAAKGKRPVVDGLCRTNDTIEVTAPDVTLKGLRVIGATDGLGHDPSEVDFTGVVSGTATNLVTRNTCDERADYGVNVFQGGHLTVTNSVASGFADSGFYFGEITDTGGGRLLVRGNEGFGSSRGIVVEKSAGGKLVLSDNAMHDNDLEGADPDPDGILSGIFLSQSVGVIVNGNTVTKNGAVGIDIAADSANNVLNDNVVKGNPVQLQDDGTGDCGSGNKFGSSGNILPACP